jgi:hypothetical protein
MRDLLNGLRHAVRQLNKSLGLTTIVIITLALAIGANTIIYSIVDAVMLRPLPYTKPQHLVEVERTNRGIVEPSGVSYPEFFHWRLQNHTLEHLVSYHDKTFTLTGVARAVQLDGEVVSWDLLSMLGIRPELGRGFTSRKKNGAHALPSSVITYGSRNLRRTSRFWAAVLASAGRLTPSSE